MKYQRWLNKNTTSLKGKTVAISGATGGIGSVLCDYLAYLGANIICLDRNKDKSIKLIDDLKTKYPSLEASHITIDLENFELVKDVTDKLKNIDIDFLVLNAGAYKIPRHKCSTGYDNVFQINFVSPYYIARELSLKIVDRGGKIIAVSSIAHNYSKLDFNDVDFSARSASSLVYGNAKRFLTLSLFSVFKGKKTLSLVHPGITLTNITAHFPKLIFSLIKYPMKIIFMSPKKAALSILCGLFNNTATGEWIGPRFFNVWGYPKKSKLKTFTYCELKMAEDISQKIYEESLKN